jgi:hypothetical protein
MGKPTKLLSKDQVKLALGEMSREDKLCILLDAIIAQHSPMHAAMAVIDLGELMGSFLGCEQRWRLISSRPVSAASTSRNVN